MIAFAGFLASAAWFGYERWNNGVWPGGSSLPGFTFGVAGGLIIVFEMALWAKKQYRLRNLRIGRAKVWMAAHIWLGLLTAPLLWMHSGFRLGGPLSATLLILLFIVVISGVIGLWLQSWIPKKMLSEIPAETIYSQIDHLVMTFRRDAHRMVAATCGTTALEGHEPGVEEEEMAYSVAGSTRREGNVQGKVLQTQQALRTIARTEALAAFYQSSVAPFLTVHPPKDSRLRSPGTASDMFRDVRVKLEGAPRTDDEAKQLRTVVDRLEDLCNQRRQWTDQKRLHLLLHGWLWIHLPLSVAMFLLMWVHVFYAIKYW